MSKRIEWLDIAKGITIILMVLGHSSIPKPISNWIWSFHMPLFFFASGICTDFERTGVMDFFCKKVMSIGRPFWAQGGLSVADGCRCLTKELDMIAC